MVAFLLDHWERLKDHAKGFRRSPEYARWKALLHYFYDLFPDVEHFSVPCETGKRADFQWWALNVQVDQQGRLV